MRFSITFMNKQPSPWPVVEKFDEESLGTQSAATVSYPSLDCTEKIMCIIVKAAWGDQFHKD